MAIKQQAQGITAKAQSLVQQVADPTFRQKHYTAIGNFAKERPYIFSLALAHIFFSAVPLLLFFFFAFSTAALSFTAATAFTLFWITSASLVLLLTLFISISIGMTVWIWGVAGFIIAKWIYKFWTDTKIKIAETIPVDQRNIGENSIKQKFSQRIE